MLRHCHFQWTGSYPRHQCSTTVYILNQTRQCHKRPIDLVAIIPYMSDLSPHSFFSYAKKLLYLCLPLSQYSRERFRRYVRQKNPESNWGQTTSSYWFIAVYWCWTTTIQWNPYNWRTVEFPSAIDFHLKKGMCRIKRQKLAKTIIRNPIRRELIIFWNLQSPVFVTPVSNFAQSPKNKFWSLARFRRHVYNLYSKILILFLFI